ncbi:SdrD B-like domain-containing protein [Marinovum sp.]|uniref:DUF7467 domain-containing protein n=1 Tax=Marinovum sp. TaxID=2024839 RepID=UPI003A8F63E0
MTSSYVKYDCLKVTENTTAVIDLDCGSGTPTDVGLNACDIRDDNGYNKPSELTIIYNPDASGQNSQGDKAKLQGSNDDDDTAYIVIRAKDDSGELYFQGAVTKGDAITFGPGVGDTLESNTYMAVYEDEAAFNGGSGPLQTIGLHTSCSAPIIIGESVGSVVISGFGFDAGGTLDSYGGNDGPGDDGVTYSIVGGADANLFEVDPATGEVSFKDAPDYENPQDAGGDNTYEVVVRATRDDGSFEDKPLEVCVEDDLDDVCIDENTKPVLNLDLTVVCPKEAPNPDLGVDICALTEKENNTFGEDTEKPGAYLLKLGDLSGGLVTSDTTGKVEDKVEVGALMGTDDGDGTYFILVSRDGDPSKTDKLFFSDDVQQGESFVASEDAFNQDFGSETFVHIFSSENGSLLQTINFHTSCSSPLIIGDEYGSVSLQGASLEGKDSETIYEVGGTEMTEEVLGEGDIVYSIVGGADAAFFTIDPDTGELSFINAPDFENPQDAGGDNVYDVVVRATAKSDASCFTEKPLEICVEDVPELGSLSGRYFCDTNDNDVDDGQATDPGIAGVLVTLLDAAGNPVLDGGSPVTTATGPQGTYSFTGLAAGTYGVRFTDPGGVLAGKQLVAPNDPDGNGDDSNDSDAIGDTVQSEILGISVAAGQDTPDNDAGAEEANNNPEVTPDAGKGCANEDITVDFSDNYSDPDGDPLTITMVNGEAIIPGGPKIFIDGVEVTLTAAGEFIFNGETAYVALDIGEEATKAFEVKVEDDQGGFASADINVTFCGAAETLLDICESLPDSLSFQVIDENNPAPLSEEAFTLKISGSGDARFDGLVIAEAYCISAYEDLLAGLGGTNIDDAPLLAGDIFCEGNVPAGALPGTGLNGEAAIDNLDLISWILNQDFASQGYTDGEIQGAIWGLTDGIIFVSNGAGDQADAQEIYDLAVNPANEGFEAGPGEIVTLVITPDSDTEALGHRQPFIVGLGFDELDCLC